MSSVHSVSFKGIPYCRKNPELAQRGLSGTVWPCRRHPAEKVFGRRMAGCVYLPQFASISETGAYPKDAAYGCKSLHPRIIGKTQEIHATFQRAFLVWECASSIPPWSAMQSVNLR